MALTPLEKAILKTVAYADLFDYALTAAEIHRYLMELRVPAEEVYGALPNIRGESNGLAYGEGYYALRQRPQTIVQRKERRVASGNLWKKALRYARAVCQLPYVSMIAVTGSLSMDNAVTEDDIDFLIVTRNDRLWGVRLCVISLAKAIQLLRNDRVCANFLIAERNLRFSRRDVYTAHEVAQMVPLFGFSVYRDLMEQNGWAKSFLPNFTLRAEGEKGTVKSIFPLPYSGRLLLGAFRDGFLQRLQIERIRRRQGPSVLEREEVIVNRDCFKGHVDGHGLRIRRNFAERVHALGLD